MLRPQAAEQRDPTFYDAVFKNRYMLWILEDGTIYDSRKYVAYDVPWEKLNKIVISINGKDTVVEKHPTAHKFFLCFRNGGTETINNPTGHFENGAEIVEHEYKKIHDWCAGVTDGKECFIVEVDFLTGAVKRAYTQPLSERLPTIHPRIKELDRIYHALVT